MASKKLLTALRNNRLNPKPYIALGYLLLLSNDQERARRYFREALTLDPGNPMAQDFLKSMEEVQHVSLSQADKMQALEARWEQQASQEEIRADDLEKLILVTLQQIMGELHQPSPSEDPEQLSLYQSKLSEIESQWQGINRHLAQLETQIDTLHLQQQVRPLEILMRRYQKAITHCEQFQTIRAEIGQAKSQTLQLIHRVSQQTQINDQLDVLLDQCDALADQLDALEAQNMDYPGLINAYEELLTFVDVLQQQIDETPSSTADGG